MAERRDTDTKMDGSTVQRLVNPTKDYRYVLIIVDMVFIGFTTTICQTIEIGRISKDLKGFERILLDFNGIVRHVDRFFGT